MGIGPKFQSLGGEVFLYGNRFGPIKGLCKSGGIIACITLIKGFFNVGPHGGTPAALFEEIKYALKQELLRS